MPFFNDERVDAIEKRVVEMEKAKAALDKKLKVSEDKLKKVEAENVVLKNEVLVLNEKVGELQAGNVALNEVVNGLLMTNEQLITTHASLGAENELVKKAMEDLQADKKIKTKQLEKLYVVIEDRLGLSVDAECDQIGIRRAEARRIKRERKAIEEAVEAAKDKGKGKADDNVLDISQFNLVGAPVNVPYSKEETSRRIEVELRRMKTKKDDIDDDENEEDSDDVFQDIDDYHGSDDKGDGDDDDDHSGNTGALIVKQSSGHQVHDYLDDSRNEEYEDVHPQGESTSGATHDEPINLFSNTPKVIYLNHEVEEGEIVENWTRESMMEALGINDENIKFDIEDDIAKATPDSEGVFKMVDEADNFNNVIMEDDSESDQEVTFHYSNKDSEDFPTFAELFRTHNEDELKRKVVER
ncbi:hypothetical protein HanRHA438_Chr05g0208311 [Helianthus annuus]|uniref:Uncharacterized protein n=1 Tax=Helianthus annuus TaxID=4232 RepID=A0A9K3NLC6_HELAN|nr:hypothetical protein HanXRQr2_Chr05g0198681 [Helianthus annuus]KAJ0569180.1 hypothetical protein HanHA300_Chr05g0163131 [Helianthus annuus]KAJ0583476.1 hypothetical protein HanHA89_Chr05g0177021 [Helianthus annuus]KAJ0746210.1 hypothetical protein HanOQP8_Chr05g0174931 [Helianthus annuus]KAJ0749214.1 hypothetical protein HanLR1_Chr05g0167231 [Helianthus annuus]